MSANIHEAKQKLPLPALMHRLGLGEHAKKSARCPFHEDKRNSFSVWRNGNGWFFKCHAGCGEGDEITFLEKYRSVSNSDAIKLFLEMAGMNGTAPLVSKPRSTSTLNWHACVEAFTNKHIERLTKWRCYTVEFCSWLKEAGLVGLYNGLIAFPVHDHAGNVGAVHYRLKDGSWRYYPQGAKVRPLVIGELVAGEPVYAFESQWDAFAFMDVSGERCGVIVTRGASNGALVSGLIAESSTTYVWTQNNSAGEKWQNDICANTKASVKRAKTPELHKDLNAWTKAGATADDLLAAIMDAQALCQPEKPLPLIEFRTPSDVNSLTGRDSMALANPQPSNESPELISVRGATLTESQLDALDIAKRNPFLGDFFYESDLGFISGKRGTGKTWLGLHMARGLAEGTSCGPYKAHCQVKVLYIDGEMPLDEIRARNRALRGACGDNLSFLSHQIVFDRAECNLCLSEPRFQDAVTRLCEEQGYKVVFLDNQSTLITRVRENSADDWRDIIEGWLLGLRRRRIEVVIINHAGRNNEMRGTSKREDPA